LFHFIGESQQFPDEPHEPAARFTAYRQRQALNRNGQHGRDWRSIDACGCSLAGRPDRALYLSAI